MTQTYVCNVNDPVRAEDARLKIIVNAVGHLANELATGEHPDDLFKSQVLQEHAYALEQERVRLAGGDAPAAIVSNETPLGMPKINWGRTDNAPGAAGTAPAGKETPLGGMPKIDWGRR